MGRTGRRARIAGTVLRGLLALLFLASGAAKLAGAEAATAAFVRFGYPAWLVTLVGAAEILGALALLARGYAALGAGLLAVVMAGAVASHLQAGDPLPEILPALILLALLLFVAYAQRRRLRAAALTIAEP